MEATFFTRLETSLVENTGEDEETICLIKKGSIPFVPPLGMSFRPNRSDDIMTVEDVLYCGETGRLEIHLSPHFGTIDILLAKGWCLQ